MQSNNTSTTARSFVAAFLTIIVSIAGQIAWAAMPSGIPDRDYIIWGTAYFDGVALTRNDIGYNVSLRLDGEAEDLVSYTMGSEPANQDWYVLRVPMSIEGFGAESAQSGNTAHIYINGVLISEAYLEPSHQSIPLPIVIGNPAETIRMSVHLMIGGDPPSVSDLTITPDEPKTPDDLIGSYDYYDNEQNPESSLSEIRWYKDSQPQTGYDDTLTIPSSATAKDQQWYFTVKPHDGFQFGSTGTSNPVTIGNTEPVASDPAISPSPPLTEDDLTASYGYSDDDGDPESGTTIRWYKNGNIQSKHNDSSVVQSDSTAKGQQWRFTVRPGDGTELGTYKTSPTVTIGDTSPVADAGGPYEIQPGEEVTFDGSGSYDADGDLLVTYSWDFGDESVGTGVNPWHLYAVPGLYLVTLIVSDGTADSAPSATTAYVDDDPNGTPSAPINLAAGWNLISLPKQPVDNAVDSVLYSIQGKYDSIMTYDTSAGIWLKYVVDGPLFLNTLNELISGTGYWIKMNLPAIWVVQGLQPATAVLLKGGWNPVGYGSETSRAIEDCMSSIDGKYNSVLTYDADERVWLRYVPGGPPSLNSLKTMEAGRGYLIYAREECIWDNGL